MRFGFVAALISVALSACATTPAVPDPASIQPRAAINVWPGVAPGSEAWTQQEITGTFGDGRFPNPIVRNVTTPTLTAYLPDPSIATGAGVIVAPGGGFLFLSIKSEGTDVAQWLASRGIAAFVLKYRLRETPPDQAGFMSSFASLMSGASRGGATGGATPAAPMADIAQYGTADAVQALALIRAHAGEYGVDPARLGIVGFSAGARVAAGAMLHSEPAGRPAFAAPIYGGLFGETIAVPRDNPPMFAAVSVDDAIALRSTLDLVQAVIAAGGRPELHMFNGGGHGYGLNQQGFSSDHWIESFYWWLDANHFLEARAP